MRTRITLYADESMIITDGETYGTTISLAEGTNVNDFYEITQEEYAEIKTKEFKTLEE